MILLIVNSLLLETVFATVTSSVLTNSCTLTTESLCAKKFLLYKTFIHFKYKSRRWKSHNKKGELDSCRSYWLTTFFLEAYFQTEYWFERIKSLEWNGSSYKEIGSFLSKLIELNNRNTFLQKGKRGKLNVILIIFFIVD